MAVVSVLNLVSLLAMSLAAFNLFLALLCFVNRSRQARLPIVNVGFVNLFAALFGICCGMTYHQAAYSLDYSFFYKASWIGWIQIPFMFQTLLWIHSTNRILIWASRLSLLFWGLVITVGLQTEMVEISPISLIPYVEVYAPLEVPLRIFGFLQIALLLILSLRIFRKTKKTLRMRVGYLTLGFGISSLGVLAGAAIFPLLFHTPFDPILTSFFGAIQSAVLTYAMLRQRLVDIRYMLGRLLYGLSGLLAFGIANYVAFMIFMPYVNLETAFILGSSFIAGILFFTPIQKSFQEAIFRILGRRSASAPEILRRLTNLLIANSSLDDIFRRFGLALQDEFLPPRIGFYLREGDAYSLKFSTDIEAFHSRELHLNPNGLLHDILIKRKELFLKDEHIDSHDQILDDSADSLRDELDQFISDELILPIALKDETIGFIALAGRDDGDPYLEEDLIILQSAATQLAFAVENARLFEEAVADGLTGLFHHKYFRSRLQTETIRSVRHGKCLGVILIDIDHFQSINDNLGPQIGDSVLTGISRLLKAQLRVEDVVARYGSEQFGVLLLDTQPEFIIGTAERIRQAVQASELQTGLTITVSIGAASFDPGIAARSITSEDLILAADRALYEAKGRGRNRVILSPEDFRDLRKTI